MLIDITKKEYRILIDIFQIADWVLHAFETEKNPKTKKYRKIEQKFMALAEEMGYGHLIEYAPEAGEYYPTAEYEDESEYMDFIDEYNDLTFWDELSQQLARRDLIREEGEEKVVKMDSWERFEKVQALAKDYLEEFEANGLENVDIALS